MAYMKRAQAIAELKKQTGAIRRLGITAMFMFGSTARDEAKGASDLDLFVDYDRKSKFNAFDLVAAKRLLERALGTAVDLTTRDGLHPLIRKRIEAEARRVF